MVRSGLLNSFKFNNYLRASVSFSQLISNFDSFEYLLLLALMLPQLVVPRFIVYIYVLFRF